MKKGIMLLFLLLSVVSFAEKQVVTWAYMADAEPINWYDKKEKKAKGLQVEIVEHCLKNLGIEVQHKFYPWARAQKLVEQGKIDGMITTPNGSRWKYASYGKELVLTNFWNIFVKKGNTELIKKVRNFTSLEDLKPYKLADFIGNGWSSAFMKKGYKINSVPRLEQLPLLLASGRCDMIINSSNWINWWAEKKEVAHKIIEIDNEKIFFSRFEFVFMVSRKSKWIDKGLLRAMDEELKKMKESGEWKAILKKYRDPHGFGKPFNSQLKLSKYYEDYDNYPIYKK